MGTSLDVDEPESQTPQQRRERRAYQRHQLFFGAGMGLGFFGFMATRLSVYLGVAMLAGAAVCWVASGVSAIVAQRHMFNPTGGGYYGNVRVRSSGFSPTGSKIVGVILILLGLGLANAGGQILLAVLSAR